VAQAPPPRGPHEQRFKHQPLPTSKSGSSSNSGGAAVNNIQDLQKATIQIESDGTFVDPQEGVVVMAPGRDQVL